MPKRLTQYEKDNARPAQKDAKYYTHCLNCDRMLVRMPVAGPTYNSSLVHMTVNDYGRGPEVTGWTRSCRAFLPEAKA